MTTATPNTSTEYARTAGNTRRVTSLMREMGGSWYRDGWPLARTADTGNGDAARVTVGMSGPKRVAGRVEYMVTVDSPLQSGSIVMVDVVNGEYWVRPHNRIAWPDVPELADPTKASYARYALGYGMEDRPRDSVTGDPCNLPPMDQAAYRLRYQLEALVTTLHQLGFTPMPYSATPDQF